MIYKNIFYILGRYFFYFSFLLLAPFAVSAYFEFVADPKNHPQPHSTFAFLLSFVLCLLFSAVFRFFGKGFTGSLHRKEGILIVVLIWVLSPAISSIPFILSGALSNPVHAYFESVSGFSTTGATVMTAKKYDLEGKEIPISVTIPAAIPTTYIYLGNIPPIRGATGDVLADGIEAVSKGVLFWRSLIQWLGGMGVVLLFILVFPGLGIGGRLLISSEMPGPVEVVLTPRISETASILWKAYLFFTLLQLVLLKLTNSAMPWFDAVTLSLSTLPTGGFSVRNANIGFYQNSATEWVILGFMVIGSLNFAIWFYIIKGQVYKVFEREVIIYFLIVIFSSLFVTYTIMGAPQQLLTGEMIANFSSFDALRTAAFQVVSANSSTGFATSNFDIWPYKAQALMLILMYIGGMAGSTAGGIKILRNYILFKTAQFRMESIYRPEAVRVMHTTYRQISNEASVKALIFFFLIAVISVIATFLFIVDGVDLESALTLVGCHINNVGFGFRAYGPMQSCAFLSEFGMLLSCFLMIVGRLEFFAIITILVPSFWRKNT